MLKEIKRQLGVNRSSWIGGPILTFGVTALLLVVFGLVLRFTDETGMPAIGNIVMYSAGALYGFIIMVTLTGVSFNMALKMGATRRQYLPATFVTVWLYTYLLMQLGTLWKPVDSAIMGALGSTSSFSYTLQPMVLVGIAFLATLVGAWFGAMLMVYGRKGFWIVYGLFMVFGLGSGFIGRTARENPDSLLGRFLAVIFRGIESLPVSGRYLLVGLLCLGLFIHLFVMLHRVQAQD